MSSKYYGANATLSTINTSSFSLSSTIDIQHEAKSTMKKEKEAQISKQSSHDSEIEKKVTTSSVKSNLPKAPISKLSLVAIALTICLSGLVYYHDHRQISNQKKAIATMQTQIANLKQTTKQSIVNDLQNNITEAVNQQNQQFSLLEQRVNRQLSEQQKAQQGLIDQINDTSKLNEQSFNNLNERLSAMSTIDSNVWLISQANYLVHLAGRKIWNDQDYTSARLLLKSADESLAQTNDPSLLPARQAINKDISSLSQISFVDTDGIIMTLMSLSESLTDLPLVDNYKDLDLGMTQYKELPPEINSSDTPDSNKQNEIPVQTSNDENSESNNISSSISDWSSNLLNNTSTFMQKFITIEKLDENENNFATCLSQAGKDEKQIVRCQILKAPLSLEQSLYLRENIRFRLLIAAQAVPRHQEQIYQQALNDTATWVNAYFDGNASSVKAFLNDLDTLQNQSISNQYVPEKLASASELEKLMQTRVHSMLSK